MGFFELTGLLGGSGGRAAEDATGTYRSPQ